MTKADVKKLLAIEEIAAIKADRFPARISLEGILQNDTRIVAFKKGELVVREGDYGNSAFLILKGSPDCFVSFFTWCNFRPFKRT